MSDLKISESAWKLIFVPEVFENWDYCSEQLVNIRETYGDQGFLTIDDVADLVHLPDPKYWLTFGFNWGWDSMCDIRIEKSVVFPDYDRLNSHDWHIHFPPPKKLFENDDEFSGIEKEEMDALIDECCTYQETEPDICKEAVEPVDDPVNHPSHYTQGEIECIDAIKAATGDLYEGYLQGQIIKYVWRYRHKGANKEDLEKAKWYMERLIELYGKK